MNVQKGQGTGENIIRLWAYCTAQREASVRQHCLKNESGHREV